jgi:Cof subfamily protein (haloacid dehalogenase superfamily)
MSRTIHDYLIVSDLDNTLLTAKEGIPEYNIEMISKFQKMGGLFTVATGRSVDSVANYLGKVSLNCPAIVYNGGIIYDFNSNRILQKHIMPESSAEVLSDILSSFPDIGCEVMCDNLRTYWIRENSFTYAHLHGERMSYVNTDLRSVANKWIKVLFSAESRRLAQVKEYCESLNRTDMDFVMTSENYLEILPKGISKGKALSTLCSLTGKNIANTVAIGDYYNDIEILSSAGLSVCVDNAPDEVKKISKLTVPSCMDGGVGYLLEQIMDIYR